MDLKHSLDITASSETYIHDSKSTDFIKPKDSTNNLEAQNLGKFNFLSILKFITLKCLA